MKTPEIRKELEMMFDEYLINCGFEKAISRAHTRLDLIEEHLGADDDYCIIKDLEYGDREPRTKVTDQFAKFATIISEYSCQTTEVVMVAGNVTEIRARFLKEKLASAKKVNERFMTSPQIALFLLNDVPDEYKACSKSAASKAAFDVMRKALEMFPSELQERKAKRRGAKVIEYIERMDFS
jgi:hypothetical protein